MYKYKCTECGQEYDELQEYCDCGNDSFDVIESDDIAQSSSDSQYIPYTKTFQNDKKITNPNRRYDIPSVAFLVVCIIFSFFILFFVGNPPGDKGTQNIDSKKEKAAQSNSKKQIQNIPSIDELWIENRQNAAAVKKTELQQQTHAETPQAQTVENIQKTISDLFKPAYTPSQPAAVTKPAKTTKQTTQSAVKKVTSVPAKKTQPKAASTVQKPKKQPAVQQTAPKQTSVKPSSVSKQITPKTSKPKVNTAAQKQALLNYKIALRNKIASNINFATVVGDGSCAITFKIAQSGKLINRAFSKQSTNDSLNDAVYNGVMLTPSYNPPPAGYKNETLKLSVKMYGGNFEVDLN